MAYHSCRIRNCTFSHLSFHLLLNYLLLNMCAMELVELLKTLFINKKDIPTSKK